jgi:hypothetical protein
MNLLVNRLVCSTAIIASLFTVAQAQSQMECAPPEGGVPGRASRLGCETLYCHPLRGFERI